MKKQTTLSRYLKSLRAASGLTLRAVEDKTGISNALLSQLESGKVKQPSPVTLYKLADFYKVPYETLMEKAGYPMPSESDNRIDKEQNAIFKRIGRLSEEEEEALLEYLSFLRSRSSKKRGKT